MQERWDREQTRGWRTAPAKGFNQNRLLWKRLAFLLPLAQLEFMWSRTTLKTNTMQNEKHTGGHHPEGQSPEPARVSLRIHQ